MSDAIRSFLLQCLKLPLAALRRLGTAGMLGILALGLLAAETSHASPPSQSGRIEVRIQRITLVSDFEDTIRTTFDRGARINAELELKDLREPADFSPDDSGYLAEYTLSFVINSLRSGTVYRSRDEPANIIKATLEPGELGAATIIWNVPYDFPAGEYNFRVEISTAENPNGVEHYLRREFRINDDSRYVLISDDKIDFGNVVDEETPRSAPILIAPINGRAGDFKWRITQWPSEWLDLVEPPPDPLDPTRSIEVVNNDYTIILQVKRDVLSGAFTNEDVVITANAGEYIVNVSGRINRNASGKIDSFKINPPKQVDAGDDVSIRYRLDNDGRTDIRYRVTFSIMGPTNAIIYDSSVTGEDPIVEVPDDDISGNLEFLWQVPYGAVAGNYRVGIELRYAKEFGAKPFDAIDVFGSDAATFKVLEGPKIRVSPTEFQFGSVLQQTSQPQEASFSVTNVGRLNLEWEVASIPDWMELVSPTGPMTEDGWITIRVKGDIQAGNYADEMVIESNGGRASVKLGVNIRAAQRHSPTPTPSPTPVATATPVPTHTPAPTDTPVPPTATPVPTATPTPEHTPTAAPIPTATPTPEPTPTATPILSTPTPEPTPTAAPTDTPVPPTYTPTPEPTVTDTPVPTHTPVPPTATSVPPTATSVPLTATNTAEPAPTHTPDAVVAADDTPAPPPPTAVQPGLSDTPPGGACSESPQPVSPLTGMANLAALLLPIAVAGGARWHRRRSGRAESDGRQ